MKNFIAALLLFLFVTKSISSDNEYYFRFMIENNIELDKLTDIISIDNVTGNQVYAYANDAQFKIFRNLNYSIEILPHPSSLYYHEMADSYSKMQSWDKYPTYQAYLAMMRQFETSFPHLCKLDTLGYSVQGRQILGVKISDNINLDEDEPEFLYTSTMHGDETVGYVLLLRLIDYLLNNYGLKTPEGQRVTSLVNNLEIWINPLANPDGSYWQGGDTTLNFARRNNANNIDLNRNFPDRITNPNNTTIGKQPETKVMMEFAAKRNFVLSANFHGGAQVVNYPWDNGAASGTYSASPDDAWFIYVSRKYASPNPDIMTGGFTNGITNGCKWYVINGGRQDWIYYWHGSRETTIELWNTKNPAGSVLPQRWTNNKESLLAYMEEASKGIRGIITDFHTGMPIRAKIDVAGFSNVPVFSDSIVGNFHRLLLPGTYNLIISSDGFYKDTLYNINVTDTGATRLNVKLRNAATNISNSSASKPEHFTFLNNYPNPFNPLTTINYELSSGSFVTLKIHDILGMEVATLVETFEDAGYKSVQFDGSKLSSGVYYCKLTAGILTKTNKLLLIK